MSKEQPDLSIVILCYKAGDFAPVFVDMVRRVLEGKGILSYELVLVANYKRGEENTDQTPKIVRELGRKQKNIVVVAREKEGMMGWDMRTGLDSARGKFVAVIDGDGQMPPEDIVNVFRALSSGPYDVAKTYRNTRFDGWQRVVISRVYNLIVKILFPKVCARDLNSKPKVFTSEALKKLDLKSDDWFIDAEMMIKGTYLDFKIIETPTTFYPNANRPSFVSKTAIFEFIGNLIKYRIKLFRELKQK